MFRVEQIHQPQRLSSISFSLVAEEILFVSGKSGAGKSVLLRCLADLDEHEGQVWLYEQAQHQTPPALWRRQVMWFPAETAWWLDEVGAHFSAQVCPTINQAWLNSSLAALHLEPSILTKNARDCSSGEKQRLALLRGLIHMPKVLLLDEITANLDMETSQLVEQLIGHYLQENQACALWVSHEKNQQQRLQAFTKQPPIQLIKPNL